MPHHKEASLEGACLQVISASLCTLSFFDTKYHQQVSSFQAHGNHLTDISTKKRLLLY